MIIAHWRGRDKGIPGAHQSANPGYLMSSRPEETPSQKRKKKWIILKKQVPRLTSVLHTCIYMHTN